MEGPPREARVRALVDAILELESLRRRVPEAVYEGEAEEVLYDAYLIFREYAPVAAGPVRRPYTGIAEEARLLAQLASALRMRMKRAGTPYVVGAEYFVERLDLLLANARALIGRHPSLPLGLGEEYMGWV